MGNTLPTDGKFRLISLRYAIDALAPVMSAETLSLHHGKHLQAYVDNLNAAVPGTVWQGKALEDIVTGSEGALFNAAGQVFNHNMFFGQMRPPREGNVPTGRVARLIDEQFGGFEGFRSGFEKAGALRLRLGVALRLGRGHTHRHSRGQRVHSARPGAAAIAHGRRVGARLLCRLPQPPSRLSPRPLGGH